MVLRLINFYAWLSYEDTALQRAHFSLYVFQGRRGRGRMVIGCRTTNEISAYRR